jgi:hypothetical protein
MPRINSIKINIDVEGEPVPMYFPALQKELNRIGKTVVNIARKTLKEQGKVVSGNLSKSLYYTIEGSKDTIELIFTAGVPYWDFVEQGVQGANPNKPKPENAKGKHPYTNRAPDSEYRFGSGRPQPTKGTLRGGIDKWVIQKPYGNIRGESGKFIPRKQMVGAISSNIYTYGLAPSNYYTIALDKGWKKAKRKFVTAIGTDIADFIYTNMEGDYTIEIYI